MYYKNKSSPNLFICFIVCDCANLVQIQDRMLHSFILAYNLSVPFQYFGNGAGPSELGNLACKLWELGKVELYKKYFKHNRIQFKYTVHVLCLKHSMALFFQSTAYLKFTKLLYVSCAFRCRVITGSLMRLY